MIEQKTLFQIAVPNKLPDYAYNMSITWRKIQLAEPNQMARQAKGKPPYLFCSLGSSEGNGIKSSVRIIAFLEQRTGCEGCDMRAKTVAKIQGMSNRRQGLSTSVLAGWLEHKSALKPKSWQKFRRQQSSKKVSLQDKKSITHKYIEAWDLQKDKPKAEYSEEYQASIQKLTTKAAKSIS